MSASANPRDPAFEEAMKAYGAACVKFGTTPPTEAYANAAATEKPLVEAMALVYAAKDAAITRAVRDTREKVERAFPEACRFVGFPGEAGHRLLGVLLQLIDADGPTPAPETSNG